jgi:hypothetical protein
MYLVFTSFVLFFGVLLWYADRQSKSVGEDRKGQKQHRALGSDLSSNFNAYRGENRGHRQGRPRLLFLF